MPEVTTPHVIAFCNNVARPLADALARVAWICEIANERFIALGGASFPDNSDPICDGATLPTGDPGTPDGRPPITRHDIVALLTETAALVTRWSDNDNELLNVFLTVAPNPAPLRSVT